jgi:arginase family enzyme
MAGSYPTAFRVIAVPYQVASPREGMGRGSERLLELGAERALAGAGAAVPIELIELDGPEGNEVELERTVAEILGRFPVRAMSLTAYDPSCDRENRIPPIATRLLHHVASAGG